MSEGPGRCRGERGRRTLASSITSKRSFDGCEDEKKESLPKKHAKTSKIIRQPGESILLDAREENETEAIAILMGKLCPFQGRGKHGLEGLPTPKAR